MREDHVIPGALSHTQLAALSKMAELDPKPLYSGELSQIRMFTVRALADLGLVKLKTTSSTRPTGRRRTEAPPTVYIYWSARLTERGRQAVIDARDQGRLHSDNNSG